MMLMIWSETHNRSMWHFWIRACPLRVPGGHPREVRQGVRPSGAHRAGVRHERRVLPRSGPADGLLLQRRQRGQDKSHEGRDGPGAPSYAIANLFLFFFFFHYIGGLTETLICLQVRSVMMDNIDRVLERGDRLEVLVDKTATMQGNTVRFKRQARRFSNTMWWRNVKLTYAMFLLLSCTF